MAHTFSTLSHFTSAFSQVSFQESHEFEVLDGGFAYFDEDSSFYTYPKQCGLSLEKLRRGELPQDVSLEDFAGFVQQWLFVGLYMSMGELVGLPIAPGDLSFDLENENDDVEYLTITRMPFFFRYWIVNETLVYGPTEARDRLGAAEGYLNETIKTVSAFEKTIKRLKPKPGPSSAAAPSDVKYLEKALLSVCLLHEEFVKLLQRVYNGYYYNGDSWINGGDGRIDLDEYPRTTVLGSHVPPAILYRLLTDAGWCPCEINLIEEQGGQFMVTRLFQLSKLQRPKKDHSPCTGISCKAITYGSPERSPHTKTCVGCTMIGLGDQTEDLVDIVRSKAIGVIHNIGSRGKDQEIVVQESKKSNAPMDVLVYKTRSLLRRVRSENKIKHNVPLTAPMKPYVAISHIWSDGLGNPHANAILGCQLERIQSLVNDLYPSKHWPVPFWIDTICVPSNKDGGVHDVRAEALRQMDQIYRLADKVLVLDADLQQVNVNSDPEELLLRIQYSRWNRRLWTFQEGAFAKNLYFQFAGSAVRVEDVMAEYKKRHFCMLKGCFEGYGEKSELEEYEKVYESEMDILNQFWGYRSKTMGFPGFDYDEDGTPVVRGLRLADQLAQYSVSSTFSHADRYWEGLRTSMAAEKSKSEHFAAVVEQLGWRTATVKEDEAYCLAVLLGVDPSVVTKLDKKVPAPERMAKVLGLYPYVPASIIHSPMPRLDVPCFRWAPQSFLEMGYRANLGSPEDRARVDQRTGRLFCAFPGVGFKIPSRDDLSSRDTIWLEVRGQIFTAALIGPSEKKVYWNAFVNQDSRSTQLFLILDEPLTRQVPWFNAALVQQVPEAGDVDYNATTFLYNVKVSQVKKGTDFSDFLYKVNSEADYCTWSIE